MPFRKIKNQNAKIDQLTKWLNELLKFAEDYKLINVKYRADAIIKKLSTSQSSVQKSISKLKWDLYMDILGKDYYSLKDFEFVPASDTVEYRVAKSINHLDDYIFGSKQKKTAGQLSPLNAGFPESYAKLFNDKELNLDDNINDLITKLANGQITRSDIIVALSCYRSLHSTIIEANKKWITSMENNIYGKHNATEWETFNEYD